MSISYPSVTILAGQQLSSAATAIDTGGNQFPGALTLPPNFTVANLQFYRSIPATGTYQPCTYQDGSPILFTPANASQEIILDPQLMYVMQYFKIFSSIPQVFDTKIYVSLRPY